MTSLDDQRRAAGLNPLPVQVIDAQPAATDVVTEDATIGNEERLRGIPAVGRVSGTMRGTRPGDSTTDLGERGTVILRAMLKKARGRINTDDRIES